MIRRTSLEARVSLAPVVGAIRQRVYGFVLRWKGRTCYEVEQGLDLPHQTASSAIRWLVQHGYLRASEKRRRTGTGRSAIVWVQAPASNQHELL